MSTTWQHHLQIENCVQSCYAAHTSAQISDLLAHHKISTTAHRIYANEFDSWIYVKCQLFALVLDLMDFIGT